MKQFLVFSVFTTLTTMIWYFSLVFLWSIHLIDHKGIKKNIIKRFGSSEHQLNIVQWTSFSSPTSIWWNALFSSNFVSIFSFHHLSSRKLLFSLICFICFQCICTWTMLPHSLSLITSSSVLLHQIILLKSYFNLICLKINCFINLKCSNVCPITSCL